MSRSKRQLERADARTQRPSHARTKHAPLTDARLPLTPRADAETRADGWASPWTGLGTSRDKRTSHTFRADTLSYTDAIELWRGDPIARRAIDVVPAECLRQGYELHLADELSHGDLKERIEQALDELQVDAVVEQAMRYERAYGGGAILLGANDGQALDQPLDLDRVSEIKWMTALEPIELRATAYYDDPQDPKFAQARLFELNGAPRASTLGTAPRIVPAGSTVIHESRLIVFPGVRVSRYQASNAGTGGDWGDSVFTSIASVLRDFNIAWASAAVISSDFGQPIFKLKGLARLVAERGGEGLRERLAAIEMMRSTVRAMLVDEGEEFARHSMSLAGLPELLDRISSHLAAALEMPLTLLMGQSPKGLGNEGESDVQWFYDRIHAIQRRRLRPVLRRIIRLIMRALGATEPAKWDVKFHPLYQLSDLERAQARDVQSQADERYITSGVLGADEVRRARFGGEFSFDTPLDPDSSAPGVEPDPAPRKDRRG